MNTQLIHTLNVIVKHLEYHNRMAPFPVFDTGYIEEIKQRIINMENSKIDYDKLPVAACKYCDSLYIESDEVENDVCMRCGAVNELIIYKDIADYKQKTHKDET